MRGVAFRTVLTVHLSYSECRRARALPVEINGVATTQAHMQLVCRSTRKLGGAETLRGYSIRLTRNVKHNLLGLSDEAITSAVPGLNGRRQKRKRRTCAVVKGRSKGPR